jgi:transposase-like protein
MTDKNPVATHWMSLCVNSPKVDNTKKRFTEEEIINILREAKTNGTVIRQLCRKHKIAEQTFFRWRHRYGDMAGLDFGKANGVSPKGDPTEVG